MDDAEGGDAIKRLIQGMKTEQKILRGLFLRLAVSTIS